MKAALVADLDYEDCAHDLGRDLAGQIAEVLQGGWVDNGIGSYEFWGQKGVDIRWELELEEGEVIVDVSNLGVIPLNGSGTYKTGGCDGEHRGPCTRHCWEAEVEFRIELTQVKCEGNKTFAWYNVTQG